MKPGGPLKRSDKPMAPGGLPGPTAAQKKLFDTLTSQIGCIVCLLHCRHEDGSRVEDSRGEIHHLLSGGNRISHWHVIPLCHIHHTNGKPGHPSRHSILGQYGKYEFEKTFGTEMELLQACEERINLFYCTGLTDDEPAAKTDDRDTDTDADSYRDNSDVQAQPVPVLTLQTFNKPVFIRFLHYRFRQADPDNLNAKGALDGIVEAGILQDDSAKYVKSIQHEQIKVKTYAEEKTVIEIEEACA